MPNLEPGCRAIVISGEMPPNRPTNVGKIVTVGNFIGEGDCLGNDDYWEVDKPMICIDGSVRYSNREKNLLRIDDHDTEKYFESEKELVTTH